MLHLSLSDLSPIPAYVGRKAGLSLLIELVPLSLNIFPRHKLTPPFLSMRSLQLENHLWNNMHFHSYADTFFLLKYDIQPHLILFWWACHSFLNPRSWTCVFSNIRKNLTSMLLLNLFSLGLRLGGRNSKVFPL